MGTILASTGNMDMKRLRSDTRIVRFEFEDGNHIDIQFCDDGTGIEVRTVPGTLLIKPRVSNSIEVRTVR